MQAKRIPLLVLALAAPLGGHAQDAPSSPDRTFEDAAAGIQRRLEESVAELAVLRDRLAAEKIPLSDELAELQAELGEVREEYGSKVRLVEDRSLALSKLTDANKVWREESTYVSNLLGEYARKLEVGLHIAEKARYEDALEAAKLAPENTNLSGREIHETQLALLEASFQRLFDAFDGTRFEGTALDSDRVVKHGTFAMLGPCTLFRSADGEAVGTAETRLGSLEPTVVAFSNPAHTAAAEQIVTGGMGFFPLDTTLGAAHKIEATQETFLEEIEKGGVVMYPIFAMAGIALLVALFKWIGLMFVRRPSKRQVDALLQAVDGQDEEAAKRIAGEIRGPVGEMLAAGVEHMNEPRELIEEAMYEKVLTTRLRVQRFVPFIAICAASAPLLGLLGTVTGIIRTFKMITVFGSSDVNSLSGGISEALITTKYGLIVAVPALLVHAFLSRKARGVVDQMETSGVAFVNRVDRVSHGSIRPAGRGGSPGAQGAAGAPALASELVREQVSEVLADLLGARPGAGGALGAKDLTEQPHGGSR